MCLDKLLWDILFIQKTGCLKTNNWFNNEMNRLSPYRSWRGSGTIFACWIKETTTEASDSQH